MSGRDEDLYLYGGDPEIRRLWEEYGQDVEERRAWYERCLAKPYNPNSVVPESEWPRWRAAIVANVAKAPPLSAHQRQVLRDAFHTPDVRPGRKRAKPVGGEGE